MTGRFGGRLTDRAQAIASRRAEHARRRMIEDIAANALSGVTVAETAEGVALHGRGVVARYWGSVGRAADLQLRLLVARMGRQ